MAEIKVKTVRGYSLEVAQREWLAAQAIKASTPTKRVSDSEVLRKIIAEAMAANPKTKQPQ